MATLFALLNAANLLSYFLGPSVSLLTIVGWMPLIVAMVRTLEPYPYPYPYPQPYPYL